MPADPYQELQNELDPMAVRDLNLLLRWIFQLREHPLSPTEWFEQPLKFTHAVRVVDTQMPEFEERRKRLRDDG